MKRLMVLDKASSTSYKRYCKQELKLFVPMYESFVQVLSHYGKKLFWCPVFFRLFTSQLLLPPIFFAIHSSLISKMCTVILRCCSKHGLFVSGLKHFKYVILCGRIVDLI